MTAMKSLRTCLKLGALAGLVLSAARVEGQTIFLNQSLITINDSTNPPTKASAYPSQINVLGLSGFITSMSVTLSNVNHSYADDIGVLLVGPGGQSAMLMADAGGHSGLTNVTLTFSDFAAAPLPDSGPIVAGTFKPSPYNFHVWPA